ncbi:hypothetical protein PACTADRAFT_82237 [Pachysolen tannophilus NRRL Y-2460]|uniref:SCP2 domain-containing protein n=1 Tax=Pachysolen tannophilus NRRL Y-2460 TaxID=669874 RepID=A0A1E4TPU6_PACTA|nr:hypothetical protein PACTADRAFT_82237 [Pachysolen tannophilus NRRL Y-2460]
MSFKSIGYLDAIRKVLESNSKLKESTIKKTDAIIIFNIKNKKGDLKSFSLDLKKTGELTEIDPPPAEQVADIIIDISDLDFKKLILAKTNAQRLFMNGRLKIKGNVMKAANIENILKAANPIKAKL